MLLQVITTVIEQLPLAQVLYHSGALDFLRSLCTLRCQELKERSHFWATKCSFFGKKYEKEEDNLLFLEHICYYQSPFCYYQKYFCYNKNPICYY